MTYTSDGADIITELGDVPQSSVGAPVPMLVADEHAVVVAYFVQELTPGWADRVAVVRFSGVLSHMLGWPNDEVFAAHPLAKYGIEPYGAYRVSNSSWLRALERLNAIHPYHSRDRFMRQDHYVLAFHDTTFECIASSFEVEVMQGPVIDAVARSVRKWS